MCNRAECCDEDVAEDDTLSTVVHGLPKAVVGSGEDSFDDIREGDESLFTIDFEGDAPFAFTYTRRDASNKEELVTVTDVDDKHVSFFS